MKIELLVKFQFIASHSLAGHEAPHPHRWNLEVVISGEPHEGKVVDMILFRSKILDLVQPLESQYLNESTLVTPAVRQFPTCETLSIYFMEKLKNTVLPSLLTHNPTVLFSSIQVGLCGMDGVETGAVRLLGFNTKTFSATH